MRPTEWLVAAAALAGAGAGSPGLLERCRYPDRPDTSWALPKALREVSGLTLLPGRGVLADDDERGILFLLDPARGTVRGRWPLAGQPAADFEGIALAGREVFLLTSDGRLYETAIPPAAESPLPYRVRDTHLGGSCEFEGLAYDAVTSVLLLPCKTIRTSARGVALRIYRWDPRSGHLARPAVVEVSRSSLKRQSDWTRFNASAIEVVPADGHLLVLSAAQRGLLELGPGGAVVGVRRLRAGSHGQPEGLTLTPEGDLLISDESTGTGARLSLYRCHG